MCRHQPRPTHPLRAMITDAVQTTCTNCCCRVCGEDMPAVDSHCVGARVCACSDRMHARCVRKWAMHRARALWLQPSTTSKTTPPTHAIEPWRCEVCHEVYYGGNALGAVGHGIVEVVQEAHRWWKRAKRAPPQRDGG